MTFVDEYPFEARYAWWYLLVAFGALGIGGLFGMIQALHRTDVFRGFVSSTDYYTLLTAHGVLLGLVFTTAFLCGIFTWGLTRSLDRPLASRRLARVGFGMLFGGTVLAALTILGGLSSLIPLRANVLYTFYAPLQAHPLFYVGLAVLVIGSWITGANWLLTYRDWRRENPDERIPLQAFMVLTTILMWYLSSVGVASSIVVFLLPWSLGIIPEVDPLLTRTLFWYFGHAVVYFWVLPAYFVWYTILPKLAGGRLFSDPLARVVFVLFLLLSTPVGFHHQYLDPGVAEGFKFVAMTNTMFLLLPSLLTAFTVVASIEHGARQWGGEGLLGWLRTLPWGNPAFSGSVLAGLMFAAGGFSGMINAGMNINYLIHNTIWIPGHFHLTVGTAAALTFMAISYWLVPQLTGKRLRWRAAAAVQPYLWFIGMALMSNAMHRAGLTGVPRRTAEPQYQDVAFTGLVGGIGEMRIQIAIGGILLFVSLCLFLGVMTVTWLGYRGHELRVDGSIPPALSGPRAGPRVLDNLKLWMVIAILLVVLAYGLPLAAILGDGIFFPGAPTYPT